MRIALAQIAPKLARQNEQLHKEIVYTNKESADLIVFPELSLNGYLLKDAVFEDAYTKEELYTLPFIGKGCDVVFGCAYKEAHRVYNASVYAERSGELHIYKKSTLPNYGLFQEARFFFPGDGIMPIHTSFGTLVQVVCEDMFDVSIVASIVKANPDVIIVISNSPARGFGEKLDIQCTWKTLLGACALYAKAPVLFVNRVGFEDGLGFWGGSLVVSSEGKVLDEAPLFEPSMLHVNLQPTTPSLGKYHLRYT
jgi:predicted amidohydrolase